jgi:hypothetical protein
LGTLFGRGRLALPVRDVSAIHFVIAGQKLSTDRFADAHWANS